jgi:peptidyl-prolyl cis-trans isomerase D
MLNVIRRYTRSWFTKALFYFLAITFFGGFGLLSYRRSGGKLRNLTKGRPEEVLAMVRQEPITLPEYRSLYTRTQERLRQQYQGEIPEALLQGLDLKNKVMDQLVEQKLMGQKAQELGIQVGTGEIQREIARIPEFRDSSGQFDRKRYVSALGQMGYTEEAFEAEVKKSLAINKLMALVSQGVKLVEGEARERYIFEKEKLKLSSLAWDPAESAKNAVPGDEEIKAYFDAHPQMFDLSETRKLRVARWSINDFKQKSKVSEAEVKEYYEKKKPQYLDKEHPEERRVSHIVLMVKTDASESQRAELLKKIKSIREEATKPGADFAELAKKYSEDPGTKGEGGDLGFFPRGRMIKEFEDAAFSQQVGEVSPVIETRFGYHLLKVTDQKPAQYQPLDQVRPEIEAELLRNQAHALALQEAEAAAKAVAEGQSLEKAAGRKVFTTEYLEKGETDVPELPDAAQVTEQAFYLKPGEVGKEVITGLDDLYLIGLDDVKAAHKAGLEESRDRIVRILTPEVRVKRTREMARQLLDRLRAGEAPAKIAKEAKKNWESTEWFPRSATTVPGLGISEDLKAQAFLLSEEHPWPDNVYEVDRQIVLVHFEGRQPADMKAFEEKPDEFARQVLAEKREEVFKNFVDSLKENAVTYTDLYKQI